MEDAKPIFLILKGRLVFFFSERTAAYCHRPSCFDPDTWADQGWSGLNLMTPWASGQSDASLQKETQAGRLRLTKSGGSIWLSFLFGVEFFFLGGEGSFKTLNKCGLSSYNGIESYRIYARKTGSSMIYPATVFCKMIAVLKTISFFM